MKQTILSIALCLVLGSNAFSQSASRTLKSEGSFGRKGMSTVNLYYGVSIFNGIYRNFAKNASGSSVTDFKSSSIGPVGIMYEYFVTEKIGLGAELGYSAFKWSANYEGIDNNGNTAIYNLTWNFTTIRAMGRINFHFTEDENFDGYGFLSAGYRNSTSSFKSTDPSFTTTQSFGGVIPFGFKPGLGLRYFFTENIGINVELALGTPLLCGGISTKF